MKHTFQKGEGNQVHCQSIAGREAITDAEQTFYLRLRKQLEEATGLLEQTNK